MCTVSIIATGAGFRLVTNRDVPRTRAPSLPCAWRTLQNARAVWPTDPDGGGTWVGASDRGLVLCLLNSNPDPPSDLSDVEDLRSRGLIIPELIDRDDAPEAIAALDEDELGVFAPFRLLACDRAPSGATRILEADWNRRRLRVQRHETPCCFVSSGLGDSLVLPRLPLFDRTVRDADASAQDAFHRHRWPGRPEISVLMSRPDARTVSITTVEVHPPGRAPRVRMAETPIHEPADARVR
jgi:hypothetical protein